MIVLLKTMSPLKQICCFLVILNGQLTFGQNPNSKVSIELSIPHSGEIPWLNTYSDKNNAYVIIRNNSDSAHYFYEDRYIYGYYNISFEINYKDSIYPVTRTPKLWWRNHPSYHIVKPKESLVFPHMVIDTSYANALRQEGIFENGWIGFPKVSDTVEIRVVYQLCAQEEVNDEENIGRLNYRRDGYLDYLDGDIESEPIKPSKETQKPKIPEQKKSPDTKSIIIFNEPLVSAWQKVIL